MQEISSALDLKEAIQKLQDKQAIEVQILKEQFSITYESLTPSRLIKTLTETSLLRGISGNLLGATIAITTGYLSKGLIPGTSASLLKKVLGSILVFGVAGIMAGKSKVTRSIGKFIYNNLFHRK